jgi:hypothetical protein
MVHFLGATTLPAERRASRARCCESNGGSIRSWPRPALPRVSLANRPLATHPDARLLDGPDVVPKTPLATSSCGPVRPLVRAATIVPERAPNMGGYGERTALGTPTRTARSPPGPGPHSRVHRRSARAGPGRAPGPRRDAPSPRLARPRRGARSEASARREEDQLR